LVYHFAQFGNVLINPDELLVTIVHKIGSQQVNDCGEYCYTVAAFFDIPIANILIRDRDIIWVCGHNAVNTMAQNSTIWQQKWHLLVVVWIC
jgi:hypothetical protein